MSSLSAKRGVLLGQKLPDGVASIASYFTAAGGSGSNVTFAAPSPRVPGQIMTAMIMIDTRPAGGTLWDPTLVGAQWTDGGGGIWNSGGISRGRQVYRIADGTSNDDLVVTKTAGTATGVRVIIFAFRGYTNTETPNRFNSPTLFGVGASPRVANVPANANGTMPAGLWVGVLTADIGTHPLGITSNGATTIPNVKLEATINPGGTDPYIEIYSCVVPAALGTQFPNPSKQFSATATSGTVDAWGFATIVVP